MLKKLQRLWAPAPAPEDPEHARRLAAAVLLLELARADAELDVAELQRLSELLQQRYGLNQTDLDALLIEARERAREAVSLYGFITTLNGRLQAAEKISLLEMLWKLAYADGRLDPHEEHLLRRVADMLYISHADFIRTKLLAQEDAQTADPART